MAAGATATIPGLWERYVMAMDQVTDRLNRITKALTEVASRSRSWAGKPWRSGSQPRSRPL
jgi:hypothetical protein